MSTLQNAAQVLRLFIDGRVEVSVTEVARSLAMPKSSASRLLKAMRETRLLAPVQNTPRYRVGHLFFEIARSYRANSTLIGLADEMLGAISRATGHTAYISILDGTDVLVIRHHPGAHALRVVTPLGQRAAAFATANGRVLLARFPDAEVCARFADPPRPPSPNAPRTLGDILAALAEVRRTGWCEAVDEAIPGVASVAASLGDPETGESLGCCLSFSASAASAGERRRLAEMLLDAICGIGRQVEDPFWLSFADRARSGPVAG